MVKKDKKDIKDFTKILKETASKVPQKLSKVAKTVADSSGRQC